MSPSLALLFWAVLLLGFLWFDPADDSKTSLALWVPVIWMFIAGSRLPSQWLGGGMGQVAEAIEEGNPLDRSIYSALILLAIGILISRKFKWGEFFRLNFALTAFLCFALLSVLWSDFSFIAFKRWFRDLGDYVVILVVLSDPRPLNAVGTVLRRLCYLLIPLSIVLMKYYPELGIHYSVWTGAPEYVGVASSKNTLGGACLISALALFWDTATRWPDRRAPRTKRVILVNLTFLAMTLWVLHLANCATCRVCLALGCLVIAVAHSRLGKRHSGPLKVLMPASFFLYLILVFGFDVNVQLADAVGRNGNLTGRTEIWQNLLSMHTNPVLGTGYETFWLGPRLSWIWQVCGHINEAHNGYLDIYLSLGFIGLFLLLWFFVASYRTICGRLDRRSSLGSLGAAAWTILLFYGVTEAVFKSGLMWMMFLVGAVVVPGAANGRGVSPGARSSFEDRSVEGARACGSMTYPG